LLPDSNKCHPEEKTDKNIAIGAPEVIRGIKPSNQVAQASTTAVYVVTRGDSPRCSASRSQRSALAASPGHCATQNASNYMGKNETSLFVEIPQKTFLQKPSLG